LVCSDELSPHPINSKNINKNIFDKLVNTYDYDKYKDWILYLYHYLFVLLNLIIRFNRTNK